MAIEKLNQLNKETLKEEFLKCCGAAKWADLLSTQTPFVSKEDLFEKSDSIWQNMSKEDYLEAFSQHPKIGDIESLAKKFANTKDWAENEQSGVNEATQEVIQELATYNEYYDNKFGYIFIVCATGKSAQAMLGMLKTRLKNEPDQELKVAADEQNKITKIRLEKLINSL